jgi:hypothetical protein
VEAEVDVECGVMLFHPLDVDSTRGRALLERVPEVGVLTLVVCMEGDGEHPEVIADDIGVGGIALSDTRDKGGRFAEPSPEHPVDFGHPARVAGLAGLGYISTRRQGCCRH